MSFAPKAFEDGLSRGFLNHMFNGLLHRSVWFDNPTGEAGVGSRDHLLFYHTGKTMDFCPGLSDVFPVFDDLI
nr:hypothetical protein [uncultured Desulfuromonas sp.]